MTHNVTRYTISRMAARDTDIVEWYVNEYDGPLPEVHLPLKGLHGERLVKAVDGMGEREADILAVTAENVRNAVNSVKTGAAHATMGAKPAAGSCKCLEDILRNPSAVADGDYSDEVKSIVASMIEEASTGSGCASCRKAKVIRKYRPMLIEALKVCKGC